MKLQNQRWLGLIVLLGLCFGPGCSQQPEALPLSQRSAIQSRVTTIMDHAVLFKPMEAGLEHPLVVRLAPLILQEVAQTNETSLWRDEFSAPDQPPAVVGETGSTSVNNRSHQQFTYQWVYPTSNPTSSTGRKHQGVRLTLNSTGAPVIWEVLEDSFGAKIIYVARSLELAARAEFGPPLPGRKFSVERSVAGAPRVIVANVIEDGPVTMGPMLHLQNESRDVSALICRCMPVQMRTLLGQKDYALALTDANNSPGKNFPKAPLEQCLRLPRSF